MDYLVILFYAAVGIQAAYFFILIAAFDKERLTGHVSGVEVNHPPVSVIVCAHDEEDNLRELIPALLDQQYPDFEVVVVNDRSNDGSFDYLREVAAADHRIKVVDVKQKPDHVNAKKYAITLGIKAARHDWILLTDADCRPFTKNWISQMSDRFAEGIHIVIGYSPYEKKPGFLNRFIRFETLLTAITYIGFASLGRPYMGVGRNLAYRKSLFLDNKGFNGLLNVTGGDDDLFVNQHANKKNTAICVGKESLVYSNPKTSLATFYKQKVRHLSVGKRYKFGDKFWLGLMTTTHILCWVLMAVILIWNPTFYWIGILMLARITLFSATVAVASERLGDKFESWLVPLLDFVFTIYYISTGPVALLTKKIRWTT